MRIHAIIILLVIFTFLSSIKSQEKNCTKWTPLKNQNSTEFLGDWYGYQRLTNGFKRRERCSLYQYSWNSMLNAVDMIITNIEENGNIFKREGKIFTIEPNIAQWQVELKNGYTFISSAIALNGSSYAIFAACRRNEGNFRLKII